MRHLKRLITFSLSVVLTTGIAASAIDVSSIDQESLTYDSNVDYMAEMIAACADGSETALITGARAEMQRNLKIQALGLTQYGETQFFPTAETAEEIAVAISSYLLDADTTSVGEDAVQYRIVASSLNVRSAAGTEYDKVGSLGYGTVVTFLQRQDGWVKVTDGTVTGWCKDTYLAPYEGTQEETLTPETPAAEEEDTTASADVSDEDLYWLAMAIQMEAGSNWLTDEHQLLVGNVILNRVASGSFPNTVYDVLHQAGQYPWASRGVRVEPSERAYANAQRLLSGERFCPDNVVFQSTATQGSGVYTSIYDEQLGTTTYFCYL